MDKQKKEVETMDKQKRWLFSFGKLVAMPALFLLVLLAGSMTAYAAEYELYLGSTQVTDANKDDILSDGKASYDPDTATLYLNGVSIGEGDSYYDDENGYNYSLYSGTDAVKHLVIEGVNNFASADNGMLFKVTGPTEGDNDFAKHSLMITGSGTLTSTVAGDGYDIAAMTVVGETNPSGGKGKGGVFMGNTDGTGPRLELTGVRKGADFYETGRFTMQGGTIIAQATGTPGTGVTLPPLSSIGADYIFFNGGTIAGYGICGYNESDDTDYCGAFDGSGDVSDSQLGMQRVYPAPEEGEEGATNYSDESGWCVVGMTQGDHVADTQAVLSELHLSDSTLPTLPNESIDVMGYTKDATVYSVDVEWGAMTFEYEASSWDAEHHKKIAGAGWKVYDESQGKALEATQDAINRVTVTNHSNASVFATLSYAGTEGTTGITGVFSTKADDVDTKLTAASGDLPDYLTLDTADNNKVDASTGQGKETIGTVYFMPNGTGTTDGTDNNITKWTKIGKITVGILTEQPGTQP